MTTPTPNQPRLELIAAYLDGSLDHAQAEAFEKSLATDPTLQAEVQFQRRLDASLGRIFDFDGVVAPADEAPAPIPISAAPAPRASRWRLGALVSIAAALLLALGLTYYFLNPADPNLIGPDTVYAKMQAVDFKPEWTCKDNAEFIETVQKRLGEGMLVPDDTPGLQVVGWAYSSAYRKYPISPDTMILITKKDNDNVLLLVDRASSDRKLSVPKDSGLHLFRDTVGGLVMYEVTPRSEPVVIPVAKKNKGACPATNGKP
jgi:hypothetical protein